MLSLNDLGFRIGENMKSEAMIRLYLHNIFILFGINKYVIAKYLINKEFPLL